MFPKQILEILEHEFALKPNHISILSVITKEGLPANEISKKTNIPMGRIYNFLNDLISKKLILKSSNMPTYYFIDDVSSQISAFLRIQADEALARQKQLQKILEETEKPSVMPITSKTDYATWLMKVLREDNEFMLLCPQKIIPFALLYPENEEDFIRVRQKIEEKRSTLAGANDRTLDILRMYQRIMHEGRSIKYLMWKDAVVWHLELMKKILGKRFSDLINSINKKLSTKQIQARVMETPFPYYLFISNKRVITFLAHANTISGLVVQDPNTVKMYRDLFNSLFKKVRLLRLSQQ